MAIPGARDWYEDRGLILRNALHEYQLCEMFQLLRSIQIEPMLLKGWSVARWYPSSDSRPLGDIDLVIRDEQLKAAKNKLNRHAPVNVDWHKLSELKREFVEPGQVFVRSQEALLSGTPIRVLSPEDNLHFVAIHMLRHGGWSKMWLTDVSVLMQSRPCHFDWELCLGNDGVRRSWVLAALVLANRIFGTDVRGTPAEAHRIPMWLESTVRRSQRSPAAEDNQPPVNFRHALARPWRLPHALRKRWPNPVSAAIATGHALESRYPLVHQMAYCAKLLLAYCSRLKKVLRRTWFFSTAQAQRT